MDSEAHISPIQTIGIIGEGKMGSNLFYYLLEFGFVLRWICSPEADLTKARKNFQRKVDRLRNSGILSEEDHHEVSDNTVISSDICLLKDCDLVVEAIPEQVGLKQDLFKKLDLILSPACILATNSSSIKPSALCPSLKRTSHFIGLHFFYPVNLINIVELILTENCTVLTRTRITEFLYHIKRKYLELNEKNGFILNRIFLDVQNEAFLIVHNQHISVRNIDLLVREQLFPSGIFEFFDSVGIDTILASTLNYVEDYPHKDYYAPLINRLQQMFSQGNLGRKSSVGFYNYHQTSGETESSETPILQINGKEIVDHLRFTYLSTVRRFTARSGLPISEINEAVKEYFGIEKGPFEI